MVKELMFDERVVWWGVLCVLGVLWCAVVWSAMVWSAVVWSAMIWGGLVSRNREGRQGSTSWTTMACGPIEC